MKPIDQNTARFFGLVGADLGFGGLADEAEAARTYALLEEMGQLDELDPPGPEPDVPVNGGRP